MQVEPISTQALGQKSGILDGFFVQHVGPLGIDASKNFSSIFVTNLCEAIGAVTIYETQIKSWA